VIRDRRGSIWIKHVRLIRAISCGRFDYNTKVHRYSAGCDRLFTTIELRLKIIESYIAMGLREDAIDDLQALLRLAPLNRPALHLLAELFEMKHRYEPALRSYRTLLAIDSSNDEVRQKIRELSTRF